MNRLLAAIVFSMVVLQTANAQGLKLPGADEVAPVGTSPVPALSSSTAPAYLPPAAPFSPSAPYPGSPPTSPAQKSPQGDSVLNMWNNPNSGMIPGKSALEHLAPRTGPDPNQDILVTPALGPWMILLNSYSGPESPEMARKLALELKNSYKLNAYVFNYGAEERRQEYERVKTIIEKQREFLKQHNLSSNQPLRVRYIRVEEQCGVLIGGYADEKVARQAIEGIRKLKPPDPARVPLHATFFATPDDKNPKSAPRLGGQSYMNPFTEAFIVRNPALKVDRPSSWDRPEVAKLRELNRDEPLSLFQCNKPVTLAIKQFHTPSEVQEKSSTGGGFLAGLGFTSRNKERVDAAGVSAHGIAELLRKAGLPAYVLHTEFSSVVTIGEFDGMEDPALKSMQSLLATQLRTVESQLVAADRRLRLEHVQFFPTPMPMEVPH